MTEARDVILARIADALRDVPAAEGPADVAVAREYRRAGGADARADAKAEADADADADADAIVHRFAQRVSEYHAEVLRVTPDAVAATVSAACARRGVRRLAVAPGLPVSWRPAGIELVEDGGPGARDARELDALRGALTGATVAIAETGTLALDGSPRCGRRLLTLVGDHHVCVVEASQIVDGVPAGLAALASTVVARAAPITLISGPSATSDIELTRVEGVHGPRDLVVVIADPASA